MAACNNNLVHRLLLFLQLRQNHVKLHVDEKIWI